MPDLNYSELAQLYGLEPVPESVVRLTKLVAQQNADLGEISKVIAQDQAISQRLLRAANPRAKKEEDYTVTTVQEALMRNGVGCVLLLAMGTPLTLALVKTFQTMLGQHLTSVNPRAVQPFISEHVMGSISFSGKTTGRVCLRLTLEGARRVAAQILGLPPQEVKSRSEIEDAVGELLNIVAGSFKSNLCDAGLDCRLNPPSVTRTSRFDILIPPGAGLERMAFRFADLVLFVDVTVNPFQPG
jgi:chemotaxis protein CheX